MTQTPNIKLVKTLIACCPLDIHSFDSNNVYYKNAIKHKFTDAHFDLQVNALEEIVKDCIREELAKSVVEDKRAAYTCLESMLQHLGDTINSSMLNNHLLVKQFPYSLITTKAIKCRNVEQAIEAFRATKSLYAYLVMFYAIAYINTKFHVERLGFELNISHKVP